MRQLISILTFLQEPLRLTNFIKINSKYILPRYHLAQLPEEAVLKTSMLLCWLVEELKTLNILSTTIKTVHLSNKTIQINEKYKTDQIMTREIQETCHNQIHKQLIKLKISIRTVKL